MIGQRTSVGGAKPPKYMTVKGDSALVAEHATWVEAYLEQSRIASAGYPNALTQEQRDAYALLPSLIDECKRAYFMIPPHLRTVHYLCV